MLMKNNVIVPVVAAVMLVLMGSVFYFNYPSDSGYQQGTQNQSSQAAADSSANQESLSESAEMKKEDVMMEKSDGTMMEKNDASMEDSGYSGDHISGTSTHYIRYNKADFDRARSEGKGIYLYFYATWCPICQAERPNILSTFDSIDVKDAVGFEVHWGDGQNTKDDDNIARDYGVSSQHTHVFIGGDGSIVDKKIGRLSDGELESKLIQASQA